MALTSPQNIRAIKQIDNNYILSWDTVTDATSYIIYDVYEAPFEITNNTVALNALPPGQVVNAKVAAKNASEESEKSALVINTVPCPPTSISMVDVTDTIIQLQADFNGSYKVATQDITINTAIHHFEFDEEKSFTILRCDFDNYLKDMVLVAHCDTGDIMFTSNNYFIMPTQAAYAKKWTLFYYGTNEIHSGSWTFQTTNKSGTLESRSVTFYLGKNYEIPVLKFDNGIKRTIKELNISAANANILRKCEVYVTYKDSNGSTCTIAQTIRLVNNSLIKIILLTDITANEWKLNIDAPWRLPNTCSINLSWSSTHGNDITNLLFYKATTDELMADVTYSNGLAVIPRNEAMLSTIMNVRAANAAGESDAYLPSVKLDLMAKPFDVSVQDVTPSSFTMNWASAGDSNKFKLYGAPSGTLMITDFTGSGGSVQTKDYRTIDNPKFKQWYQEYMWLYAQDKNELRKVSLTDGSLIKSFVPSCRIVTQLVVTSTDTLYITDPDNRKILKYDSNGSLVASSSLQLVSIGEFGFSKDIIAVPDTSTSKVYILDLNLNMTYWFYCGMVSHYYGPLYYGSGYWRQQQDEKDFPESGNLTWSYYYTAPLSIKIKFGNTLEITQANPTIVGRSDYRETIYIPTKFELLPSGVSTNRFSYVPGGTTPAIPNIYESFCNPGEVQINTQSNDETSLAIKYYSYSVGNADPGNSYTLKVAAIDDSNVESLPSQEIQVITGMLVPVLSLKTVDDVTSNSVRLYYSDFNKNTQLYKFYAQEQATAIAAKASDANTYIDITELQPNKLYNISMTAMSSIGIETGKSAVVSFTTCPSKVTGVRAARIRQGVVKIKWTALENNVYYKIYGLSENPIIAGTNSYVASGLVDGQTYNVTIKAFNSTGAGIVSDVKSFIPADLPIITMDISQTDSSDDFVVIEWESIPGVSYYDLYVNGSVYAENIATTGVTITNLEANTAFKVKAMGYDDAGGVFESFELTAKTTETPALAVTIDPANPISKESAGLLWSSVAGADKYKVYLDAKTTDELGTSAVLNGLKEGTKYMAQVEAYEGTEMINSDAIAFVTALGTPIGLNVPASTVEQTSCLIRWSYAGGTDGIQSINVYSGSSLLKSIPYILGETEATLDGLTADTTYSIYFKSRSQSMESAPSNIVTFTTKS